MPDPPDYDFVLSILGRTNGKGGRPGRRYEADNATGVFFFPEAETHRPKGKGGQGNLQVRRLLHVHSSLLDLAFFMRNLHPGKGCRGRRYAFVLGVCVNGDRGKGGDLWEAGFWSYGFLSFSMAWMRWQCVVPKRAGC